ncbi:MAG TPA: OmpA family protein [Candidatus Eisenbacteria bacterium]
MKFRSLCLSTALLLFSVPASARNAFEYAGVRTHGFHLFEGVHAEIGTVNSDDGSTGFLWGINTSAGTIFSPNIDLTLGFRSWSSDLDPSDTGIDGSVSDFSLHGDMSYHFFKVWGVRPYGLAGLATHFVSADVPGDSEREDSVGGFNLGLDFGIGAATTRKGLGVRGEIRREVAGDAGNWSYTVGVGWWPTQNAVRVPTAASVAPASSPPATPAPVGTSGNTSAPTSGGLSMAEAAALQSTIDRLNAENEALKSQSGAAPAAAPKTATPEDRAAAQRAAFQRVARLAGNPDGYSDGADGPRFVTQSLVTFEEGGSKLDTRDQEQIRRVAVLLMAFPGSSAVIEGHADSGGSVAANQKVTTARAEAVRGELVRLGVPAGSLTALGLGSSRPMFDNASANKLSNRRVSIQVNGATIR